MEDYKSDLLNEEIESLLSSIFLTNGVLLDNEDCSVQKATAENSKMIPNTAEKLKALSYGLKQNLESFNKYTVASINLNAQRKMIVGNGAPQISFAAEVDQFYRDRVNGYLYFLSQKTADGYLWKPVSKGHKNVPEVIITSIAGALVAAKKGNDIVEFRETYSGTYIADLTSTGSWKIFIVYGVDSIGVTKSFPANRRYLVPISMEWTGELDVEENVSAFTIQNPFYTIVDSVVTSTQIPIRRMPSENVSAHSIQNMFGTIVESVSGNASPPVGDEITENVSAFTIQSMFGTITDSVSITEE